jgi:hypothetical protein
MSPNCFTEKALQKVGLPVAAVLMFLQPNVIDSIVSAVADKS